VCISGSLRVSSWENEIQLNRELPALSMGIEITENEGVREVREKLRETIARSRNE